MVGGVNCFNNFINLKKSWISRTFGVIARMYDAWVRSGVFFDSGAVYCLDSADGGYFGTLDRYAVRPALYSTVINLKKPWISRTFGVIARMYDAWVRSGGITGDNNSCVLSSSGDRSNYSTNRCYAVRPALYSTVIN